MNTLGENKRLKSRKAIEELLAKGQKIKEGAVLMIYVPSNESHSQIAVTVQKRLFKKAVDRNRVKRLLREAYRLNQHELPNDSAYHLFFMYLGKELPNFDYLNTKIKQALVRLANTSTQHEQKD